MAYDIKKTNNDPGATVEDASLNTKFDITLIGKNFAGYGVAQNTNFLHLLENFANNAPPSKAINGQLWYDNYNKTVNVNTGTAELKEWHSLGVVESSEIQPTNLTTGNMWWDKINSNLYCKTTTADLQLIGGSFTGISTALKPRTVKSSTNADHEIIEVITNGTTVLIVSSDEFTLHQTTNPIVGFSDIKHGVTLSGLNTSTFGSTTNKMWGSSSDSDRLGGVLASAYISTTNPYFEDNGLTIGNSTKKLYLYNDTTVGSSSLGYPIIENKNSDKIIFKTKASGVTKVALEINGADLLPGTAGTSNIGSSAYKFNNIYANSFKGNADGADTLKVGSSYVSASTTATSGSIVARTSATTTYLQIDTVTDSTSFTVNVAHTTAGAVSFSIRNFLTGTVLTGFTATLVKDSLSVTLSAGAITTDYVGFEIIPVSGVGVFGSITVPVGSIIANCFVGKALTSGGDVAERYLADAEYTTGTVLMIGGEKEVTAATYGSRALGAISVHPSIMMNNDLVDGILVGLKGRLPVNVIGPVKKGDRLIAADTGIAMVLSNPADSWLVFGISLEESNEDNVKLVEAVIL